MNWLSKVSINLNERYFITKKQVVEKKLVFLLSVSLLFLACATTTTEKYGADFDKTKCDLIVKGKSTKQNILKLLGEPFNKELDISGAEKWIYLYKVTKITTQPAPGVGKPIHEGTVKEKKLEIVFDQDTVKNYVTAESTRPWSQTAPEFVK